jgi:hypothetical protein
MNLEIALLLGQDGITNGAIYALLALALVLAFAVTRVIFIPQGEFVAYGALTLVALQAGTLAGHAVAADRRRHPGGVGRWHRCAARAAVASPAPDRWLEPGAAARAVGPAARDRPAVAADGGADPARPAGGGAARTDAVSAGLPAAGRCVGAGAADRLGGGARGDGGPGPAAVRRRGFAHAALLRGPHSSSRASWWARRRCG